MTEAKSSDFEKLIAEMEHTWTNVDYVRLTRALRRAMEVIDKLKEPREHCETTAVEFEDPGCDLYAVVCDAIDAQSEITAILRGVK